MFMAAVCILLRFIPMIKTPKKKKNIMVPHMLLTGHCASTFCSEDYGFARADPKQLTDISLTT